MSIVLHSIAHFLVEIEGRKTILIKKEDALYQYMPRTTQKVVVKMPLSSDQEEQFMDLQMLDSYFQKGDVVGSEILDSKRCEIRKFEDPDTGVVSKVWIWQNYNFPIRIEAESEAGKSVTVFKDIKVNPVMSDSVFDLPIGVKVVDINDMMTPSKTTDDQ